MSISLFLIIILVLLVGIFIYIFFAWDRQDNQTLDIKPVLSKKSTISYDIFTQELHDLDIKVDEIKEIKDELHKVIIGMDNLLNSMLCCVFTGGHLLVEGVPGLAKTKTIHTLSTIFDVEFGRIQCTPDMTPADITGSEMYNPKTKEFDLTIGPIATNLLLTDEINRTTPKVQSALLEAMQEHQITINGKTVKLPEPFFVMATQNPIEQEGTYNLPEAQLDRFLFKATVDYPKLSDEKKMLTVLNSENIKVKKVLSQTKFQKITKDIESIKVSDGIADYITRLVDATRKPNPLLAYGAGPRASIALYFAGKTLAYMKGRDFVKHEDIQQLALLTMRHRVTLHHKAIIQNISSDVVLLDIFGQVSLS